MSETMVKITQTIYQPKCAACISIVQDKRCWTAKDYQFPRPYCKNPKSPFYMRIPPMRCNCFQEVTCSSEETPG